MYLGKRPSTTGLLVQSEIRQWSCLQKVYLTGKVRPKATEQEVKSVERLTCEGMMGERESPTTPGRCLHQHGLLEEAPSESGLEIPQEKHCWQRRKPVQRHGKSRVAGVCGGYLYPIVQFLKGFTLCFHLFLHNSQ